MGTLFTTHTTGITTTKWFYLFFYFLIIFFHFFLGDINIFTIYNMSKKTKIVNAENQKMKWLISTT